MLKDKVFSLLFCSVFFFCVFSLTGFSQGRRTPAWSVDDIRLQGLGDSLAVTLSWTVRDIGEYRGEVAVISPSIRNGNRYVTLTPVAVYGVQSMPDLRIGPVSNDPSEVSVTPSMSFPYRFKTRSVVPMMDWMDVVKLVVLTNEWTRGGGLQLLSIKQLGAFRRPEKPSGSSLPEFLFEPEHGPGGKVQLDIPLQAAFNGKSFDTVSSGSGDYGFDRFVDDLKFVLGSGQVTGPVSLKVYSYPEPSQKAVLSRTATMAQSVASALRSAGVDMKKVKVSGGGIDWEGVRAWTAESRLAGDARLREILSTPSSDEAYALLARERPEALQLLLNSCFPGLVRVVFSAECTEYSGADRDRLEELRGRFPSLLSVRSYYNLAVSLPEEDEEGRLDVFLEALDVHPGDPVLSRNAVMLLSGMDEVNAAAPLLRDVGDDPDGQYARAVWCQHARRYDECIALLSSLRNASPEYARIYEDSSSFVSWLKTDSRWEQDIL